MERNGLLQSSSVNSKSGQGHTQQTLLKHVGQAAYTCFKQMFEEKYVNLTPHKYIKCFYRNAIMTNIANANSSSDKETY